MLLSFSCDLLNHGLCGSLAMYAFLVKAEASGAESSLTYTAVPRVLRADLSTTIRALARSRFTAWVGLTTLSSREFYNSAIHKLSDFDSELFSDEDAAFEALRDGVEGLREAYL